MSNIIPNMSVVKDNGLLNRYKIFIVRFCVTIKIILLRHSSAATIKTLTVHEHLLFFLPVNCSSLTEFNKGALSSHLDIANNKMGRECC